MMNLDINSLFQSAIDDLTKDNTLLNESLKSLRQNFSDGLYKTIDYGYYSPVKSINDDTKYPLIIFLHGMLHGRSKRSQINDSFFPYMSGEDMQSRFTEGGAHLLLPRLPELKPQQFYRDTLQELIEDYISKNEKNIDKSQITIMGASAGGFMTWNLLGDNPDFYKKAIIACAPKLPSSAEIKKLENTPIWIISAKHDPIIPFWYQKKGRDILKGNTDVPDECRWTIFPKEVRSPDGSLILLPHFLAKVLASNFEPVKIPGYEENKYNRETYPGAITYNAHGEKIGTKGIIERLQK